jgi:hypothetical protein
MASRPTSPEFVRKGPRSALPVSRNRRTSHTTCAPGILSSKTPPSPPRSPSTESPSVPSPSRSPKNVHWDNDSHQANDVVGNERRALERKDSTDSMRANERFSPIPWVMSPPGSPPPLSLYSSVALLHYHIHHDAGPLPSDTADVSSPPNPAQITSTTSVSRSPVTSTSPSIPSSPVVSRSVKVVPTRRSLEEFKAIEKALEKSPYIIPQDLLPSGPPKSAFKEGGSSAATASVPVEEASVSGSVNELGEIDVSLGSDAEELANLVDEYAFEEERRSESVLSSPFIECTKPNVPVEEEGARETVSSDGSIPANGKPCRSTTDNSATKYQLDPLPPQNATTLGSPVREPLTRMPSIQRRGQEYLAQFMARRRHSPPTAKQNESAPTTSNRRKTYTFTISPLILILSLLLLLSLITNVFLISRLYHIQDASPLPLETVMKPGRVGETFDIFTTPSSNWWARRLKEPEIQISAPPPTRTTPLYVPNVSKVKWNIFRKERLSFGRSGKRRVLRNIEKEVQKIFGETKLFVHGAWVRIFGS